MKPCFCTLCGESVTAPQFFNGNPYGWSCITKVNPDAKKRKKGYWVAGESLEFDYDLESKTQNINIDLGVYGVIKPCFLMMFKDGLWRGCGSAVIGSEDGNIYVNLEEFGINPVKNKAQ